MPMHRKGACALLLLLATSALAAPASPPTSGLPINTSAPAHTGTPLQSYEALQPPSLYSSDR